MRISSYENFSDSFLKVWVTGTLEGSVYPGNIEIVLVGQILAHSPQTMHLNLSTDCDSSFTVVMAEVGQLLSHSRQKMQFSIFHMTLPLFSSGTQPFLSVKGRNIRFLRDVSITISPVSTAYARINGSGNHRYVC